MLKPVSDIFISNYPSSRQYLFYQNKQMNYILSFLLLLTSLQAMTQKTKSISGTVKDARNEVLVDASVKLLKPTDSTFAKGESTNNNGKFQFNNLQDGNYLLVISSVGHKKFTSSQITIDETHHTIVLPVIFLTLNGNNQLKEVVVNSKRPLIEQDIDKTIVNVEAMISAATSNTLEVLEKTPGVTVDINGSITLNGKQGVLVLIDGRATHMSGQDLASYLKSLPGGMLDKLELMDNPPSKYDAGGGAIINIKLKKNRDLGITGNINSSYSQGITARTYNVLNLNYNRRKYNWFGNIGYSTDGQKTMDFYDRQFFNPGNDLYSRVFLDNTSWYSSRGITSRLGLDFTVSEKTILGFQVNLQTRPRNDKSLFESRSFDPGMDLDSTNTGTSRSDGDWLNTGVNLNFLQKLSKPGRELSGDLNYIRYKSEGDQFFSNYVEMPGAAKNNSGAFRYDINSGITIYNAKVDYVHPLKNKASLEAGLKSSIVENDNDSRYYNTISSGDVPEDSRSNHFIYDENVNSAYLSVRKNWKRIGGQLGLRAENTRLKGNQVGNSMVPHSESTQNFTDVFPTVYISYKLDSANKHTLTGSLARRINRPNYQQFNPFLVFRDNYTYSSGNPDLKPNYQFRYELRYQYKQLLTLGLSYGHMVNLLMPSTEAIGNIFINRPYNLGEGSLLIFSTNVNTRPAKWWMLNVNIQVGHLQAKGTVYSQNLNPSFYSYRFNFMNQFTFKKGWSAELTGNASGKDLNQQSISKARARLNTAIQKKLFKDKASLKLTYEDMFHLWKSVENSIGIKQATFYRRGEFDSQRVGISFSYRFGNETFARKRRHADNAAEGEKSRAE